MANKGVIKKENVILELRCVGVLFCLRKKMHNFTIILFCFRQGLTTLVVLVRPLVAKLCYVHKYRHGNRATTTRKRVLLGF